MKTPNLIKGSVARIELGKPGPALSRSRFSVLLAASGQKNFQYVNLDKLREVNVQETFTAAREMPRAKCERMDCPVCGKNMPVLVNGQLHGHKNPSGQKCLFREIQQNRN